MFAVANLLEAAASVLNALLTIYYWLILVRALLSWVSPDPYNPIVVFLHKITEPVLEPIRRALPFSLRFGLDISPIIAFLGIMFLRRFLIATLLELAYKLKG